MSDAAVLAARPVPLLARLREEAQRFLFTPASPEPLAAFRIGASLLALAQVAILWPHLLQLYGSSGLVQWVLTEAGNEPWMPSIPKLCLLLQPYGVSAAACVHGVFAVYAVALVGVLIGWRTRLCAVTAWLAHTLTVSTGYFALYGVDTMLQISQFYCAWMPVGAAFSLDRRRLQKPAAPTAGARLGLRILQLHLCIIYLDAGLSKMESAQWWTGEALWRALMEPQFGMFDFRWLAWAPWLAMVSGWMVLLVETGYPLLIWPRRTRPLWVAATIALHAGIGLTMGLWMFSAMMIVMTSSAFGYDLVAAAVARRRAAAPTTAR